MATVEEPRTTAEKSDKVTVSLKPAGNAPLLKQRKFLVECTRTVGWLIQWLKKNLKCEPDESVFVYVAQSFAPSPDQDMGTLHALWRKRDFSPQLQDKIWCYGAGDKLILHYCKTPAWG